MASKGDTVTYYPGDGRAAVEATVVETFEDGTVNLTYPHPKAPDVPATADSVRPGRGAFQYSDGAPEAPAESAAAITNAGNLAEQVEILQARVDVLDGLIKTAEDERDAALAAQKTAEDERDAALAELTTLTATKAPAGATPPAAPADEPAKEK